MKISFDRADLLAAYEAVPEALRPLAVIKSSGGGMWPIMSWTVKTLWNNAHAVGHTDPYVAEIKTRGFEYEDGDVRYWHPPVDLITFSLAALYEAVAELEADVITITLPNYLQTVKAIGDRVLSVAAVLGTPGAFAFNGEELGMPDYTPPATRAFVPPS